MSAAYWSCAGVTVVSALVSLGYATAAVRGSAPGDPARTSSMYAFVRSLALGAVAVVVMLAQSVPALAVTALAMVLVQAGDAVVGAVIRDRLKTAGPATTAMANAVVLIWLLAS